MQVANLRRPNSEWTNFKYLRCHLHCGELIPGRLYDQHIAELCPNRLVRCPNFCGFEGRACIFNGTINQPNRFAAGQVGGSVSYGGHVSPRRSADPISSLGESGQLPVAHAEICPMREVLETLHNLLLKFQAKTEADVNVFDVSAALQAIDERRKKLLDEKATKLRWGQEARELERLCQPVTDFEKVGKNLQVRLQAITRKQAEHVLEILTTKSATDNLAEETRSRLDCCQDIFKQYEVCRRLDSLRDTVRPAEVVLLRLSDWELSTALKLEVGRFLVRVDKRGCRKLCSLVLI